MKTVSFIEAIKSGKKFKREGCTYWIEQRDTYGYGICFMAVFNNGTEEVLQFDRDDVISGRYELYENKITISEEDFDRICEERDIADGMDGYQKKFWGTFKIAMGFKE